MQSIQRPLLDVEAAQSFRSSLREIHHFPVDGIMFKDLSPMLARPGALSAAVSVLEPLVVSLKINSVLAVDARGFILGAALADRLDAGLIMVRKPGKLPGNVQTFDYTCEYCSGQLQVTAGLVSDGLRCLVVDDLLATGGTARATADFVRSQKAVVAGFAFMLEIEALNGRAQLTEGPVVSLMHC
jgi:adenine phosphoribosyltransferase